MHLATLAPCNKCCLLCDNTSIYTAQLVSTVREQCGNHRMYILYRMALRSSIHDVSIMLIESLILLKLLLKLQSACRSIKGLHKPSITGSGIKWWDCLIHAYALSISTTTKRDTGTYVPWCQQTQKLIKALRSITKLSSCDCRAALFCATPTSSVINCSGITPN